MFGLSEADTCRLHVTPKLQAAGWDREPHLVREQRTFTDGRIVVAGGRARRRPGKRADYLLCYRPDFTIAVVEAKAFYRSPADGMQQAKAYAETPTRPTATSFSSSTLSPEPSGRSPSSQRPTNSGGV